MASTAQHAPTRIVIVGGGFAGVFCARYLEKFLRRRADVEVTLVNRDNYFVYQPLLPEVAAGSIEPGHILNPVRQMLRRTRFFTSSVESIDLERRQVLLTVDPEKPPLPLPYDHLVLAPGLMPDLGRVPGMAEHALPMKTLGDAFHLRNHVLQRLEQAVLLPADARRSLLGFVVIGGGFSGVETVAELNDFLRASLKWYPSLQPQELRVVLLHAGERLLPELSASLSAFALRKLRQCGVEVQLRRRVSAVTPEYVLTTDGQRYPAGTVVATVGNAPYPWLAQLPLPAVRGRLQVDAYLRVPGHSGVWALGDGALVPNAASGEPCPPTAQHAIRQARCLAANLVATLQGRPLRPFAYRMRAQLASLGHREAVAEIMGVKFCGFPAWWLWRTLYLLKLPGLARKLRVALDWSIALLFPRDIVQFNVARSERVAREHYEAGEVIIRQGDRGSRFFVLVAGEVEVVREEGGEARVLARLGPREYFGEMALLHQTRRTATVRARTAVDVLSIAQADFTALVGHLAVLRSALEETTRQRLPAAAEAVPARPGPAPEPGR